MDEYSHLLRRKSVIERDALSEKETSTLRERLPGLRPPTIDELQDDYGPHLHKLFDYDRYRHHLNRLDLPEAAQRQLGEAVWFILRNHVDRAWGDDPVQLAAKIGGRFRIAAEGNSPSAIPSDDK